MLPKTYEIFNGTLLKELLKKVSEIPANLSYDAFGRIYEYFLGELSPGAEGHKGGEFFAPSCIVRLLVEILEPFHGRSDLWTRVQRAKEADDARQLSGWFWSALERFPTETVLLFHT